MEPTGPAFSLLVSHPLTIGTIPLQNHFNQFAPGQAGLSFPAPPENDLPPPYTTHSGEIPSAPHAGFPGLSSYPNLRKFCLIITIICTK